MKELRRLVVATFCDWLRDRLPASGKPCVHDLRARALRLVEATPDETDAPPVSLDVSSVRAGLDWAFVNLLKTYGQVAKPDDECDSWAPLALHVLRLVALASAADVLAAITRPVKGLDSSAEIPTVGGAP